jgi:hypothetical protein
MKSCSKKLHKSSDNPLTVFDERVRTVQEAVPVPVPVAEKAHVTINITTNTTN